MDSEDAARKLFNAGDDLGCFGACFGVGNVPGNDNQVRCADERRSPFNGFGCPMDIAYSK